MIYNQNIAPGERWHSTAEQSGEELFELVNTVRSMMNHRDMFTLSGKTIGIPNRFRRVGVHPSPRFVVEDRETGLYLKGSYAREANIQFDTMNYLHDTLDPRLVGVAAIQVFWMVVPDSFRLPTVSIMPAAPGKTLDNLYDLGLTIVDDSESLLDVEYSPEHKLALKDVKNRLDIALTRGIRKTLVSDFHGGNVLLEDNGVYTVIDQPNPHKGYRAEAWLKSQK